MGLLGRLNTRSHQQLHLAMGQALSGQVPAELRPHLNDAVVWTSTLLLVAIGLGIVLLMTVKPDLLGSLMTLAIAILEKGLSGLDTQHLVPTANALGLVSALFLAAHGIGMRQDKSPAPTPAPG